jgi:hypothetical protein
MIVQSDELRITSCVTKKLLEGLYTQFSFKCIPLMRRAAVWSFHLHFVKVHLMHQSRGKHAGTELELDEAENSGNPC